MLIPTARHGPAVAGLVAALLLSVLAVVPVAANTTAQSLPFVQDWTNTGLITTDDNWNAVPGIVGYRGDSLAVTGTDPQTVLVDDLVVDVNANKGDPASFDVGGVAEFELTNPVVALRGSTTARAPYLTLALNTTGQTNVKVAYDLRDIDDSANNAFQQVALQYRVGTTGTYTNLPAGYVQDATTGPSLATLVTPVNVTLPAAANNQPVVDVRIITTDAPGIDEWVGVDNISVTSTPPDTAPTVTSTSPANDAIDVAVDANLQVTFSEPVDVGASGFDVSCAGSGTHPATVSGGPTTFTLDPATDFAGSEDCTLTIVASQVTDQDTNDPPDAMASDVVVGFTTVAPPDDAPTVTSTTPADSAADVAVDADLSVTFSEPVDVADGGFGLACDTSGAHPVAVAGGPTAFTLDPTTDFATSEGCSLTILGSHVTDQDTDDPPDAMADDVIVSFDTVAPPDEAPTVAATTPSDGDGVAVARRRGCDGRSLVGWRDGIERHDHVVRHGVRRVVRVLVRDVRAEDRQAATLARREVGGRIERECRRPAGHGHGVRPARVTSQPEPPVSHVDRLAERHRQVRVDGDIGRAIGRGRGRHGRRMSGGAAVVNPTTTSLAMASGGSFVSWSVTCDATTVRVQSSLPAKSVGGIEGEGRRAATGGRRMGAASGARDAEPRTRDIHGLAERDLQVRVEGDVDRAIGGRRAGDRRRRIGRGGRDGDVVDADPLIGPGCVRGDDPDVHDRLVVRGGRQGDVDGRDERRDARPGRRVLYVAGRQVRVGPRRADPILERDLLEGVVGGVVDVAQVVGDLDVGLARRVQGQGEVRGASRRRSLERDDRIGELELGHAARRRSWPDRSGSH